MEPSKPTTSFGDIWTNCSSKWFGSTIKRHKNTAYFGQLDANSVNIDKNHRVFYAVDNVKDNNVDVGLDGKNHDKFIMRQRHNITFRVPVLNAKMTCKPYNWNWCLWWRSNLIIDNCTGSSKPYSSLLILKSKSSSMTPETAIMINLDDMFSLANELSWTWSFTTGTANIIGVGNNTLIVAM